MARPKGTVGGENAKRKLLEAAGRGFRVGGYGGAGVDGLAKEAGLTSGAFYAHFGSKAEAFRLAMIEGLEVLERGIEAIQQQHGRAWKDAFIDLYLRERMCVGLEEACALPTFAPDAARGDETVRKAYEEVTTRIVQRLAMGLEEKEGRSPVERAWSLLATLAGAASVARALASTEAREKLLESAKQSAREI